MTIREYCNDKNITLLELSQMCDVSQTSIYNAADVDIKQLTFGASSIKKIFNATKEKFGEGLNLINLE